MIDNEVSYQGVILLSTAIGELMEDTANLALTAAKRERLKLAGALQTVGQDISIPAQAMEVLIRHGEA